MLKRFVSLVILAGVIFLAGIACGGASEPAATPTTRTSPSPPPTAPTATAVPVEPTPTSSGPDGTQGTAVSVNLEDPGGSGEYMFDPSEFTFSVGDTVTFNLSAETEFHTFTVDELGISVDMDADTTDTLTFTFDQPGTFQLICIPHELLGMVGTITVQ